MIAAIGVVGIVLWNVSHHSGDAGEMLRFAAGQTLYWGALTLGACWFARRLDR